MHIPYEQAYAKGFENLGRRIPDVSKLERVVGFRPTTPVETMVDRVIAGLKDRSDV